MLLSQWKEPSLHEVKVLALVNGVHLHPRLDLLKKWHFNGSMPSLSNSNKTQCVSSLYSLRKSQYIRLRDKNNQWIKQNTNCGVLEMSNKTFCFKEALRNGVI